MPRRTVEQIQVHVRRSTVLRVVVLTFFAAIPSASGHSQDSTSNALTEIIGEELLSGNSNAVRMYARNLPSPQRMEHLSSWVIESANHSFRLNGDFSPLSPAPPVADYSASEEFRLKQAEQRGLSRLRVGGTLQAPAFDLIDVAKELGLLNNLRRDLLSEAIIDLPPGDVADVRNSNAFAHANRARLALLALTELAGGNEEKADEYLARLCRIALRVPIQNPADRWPEMLAFWRGVQHRKTCDTVSETLYEYIYRDIHPGRGIGSEVWTRHLFALMGFKRLFEDPDASADDFFLPLKSKQWAGASFDSAEIRGQGTPGPRWILRNRGIDHLAGQENDFVYYQSPLKGEFEIDALTTTFDWKECELFLAGIWAGPAWGMRQFESGDHRRSYRKPSLGKPMSDEVGDYFRIRLTSQQGFGAMFANGRRMLGIAREPDTDPWIGGRFWHRYHGGFRDVRIAGDVRVPRSIRIVYNRALTGWADYYSRINMGMLRNWRWTGSELIAPAAPSEASERERLLRYHRPMLEDGVIEYQFFYEPGVSHVHPALDRLALILKPDGVRVHWCTDGIFDRTELAASNEFIEEQNQRGANPLPLRQGDWNNVTVQLKEDVLSLKLNDQLVFERPIHPTNMRRFGFFFDPKQHGARIRNVVWTGEWPLKIPELAQQDLADVSALTSLDTAAEKMLSVRQDFRQSAELKMPLLIHGEANREFLTLNPTDAGIVMTEAAKEQDSWNGGILTLDRVLSGDFDITLDYQDLKIGLPIDGRYPGLCIHVAADTMPAQKTEWMVRRTQKDFWCIAAQTMQARQGDDESWDVGNYYMDATSGRLRLARKGDKLTFLYAPLGSDLFRAYRETSFTAADIPVGGLQLRVVAHGIGETSVCLKHVVIRADQIREK